MTVEGGKEPGEVGDISVLRAPFKSGAKADAKAPLTVVCSSSPYKDAWTGGEALVPEGSWGLFVEALDSEKNRDALCARIATALQFVASQPGVDAARVTFLSSGKGTAKSAAELAERLKK